MLATAVPLVAPAETLSGFLSRGQFFGQLRSYYFRRDYGAPSVINADAFALSGLFNYVTPEFLGGVSFGASYFTSNALGTHRAVPTRIDTTLSGQANSINALGQAFVQYNGHGAFLRLGDQLLVTPWAGPSDSRVLPATYQAAYGRFTPARGLTFSVLRILRYRGRTSEGYFRDNNYYPPTWHGDASYGGLGNLPMDAPASAGTIAAGAAYERQGLRITAWYYDFYDFAHLFYGQVHESIASDGPIKPFAGAQIVREWGARNVFAETGTHLFGQSGTDVSNFTLGAIVGVKGFGASLSVAYDHLNRQGPGALGGGAVVSPYTESFATDPLYTSSMIRGMVELGPGSAWKVTVHAGTLDSLEVGVSFAEYHTNFNGNDSETYFDIIYRPRGYFRGMSLRNRLEIGNGRVNPGQRHFLYNRVMIAYRF